MDIQYKVLPSPGRPFQFSTIGRERRVHIEATVNGDRIYEGQCPDPPCHEQMIVPEWAAGQTLVVKLTSPGAIPVVRKIAIAAKDSNTGGLTAAF